MASKLKKPQEPSEGDLVAARAAVKFAELQRKVASWLPPRTEEERAREAAQEDEDEEEFEVGYELLGVGATPPSKNPGSSTLPKRKDPSLEALRKQLLGRNASKNPVSNSNSVQSGTGKSMPHRGLGGGPPKPTTQSRTTRPEDQSDSDEGKGAMFASKRAKTPKNVVQDASAEDVEEVDGGVNAGSQQTSNAKLKRKANSFMDEILAEKGAKKKKKRKGGAEGN